MVLPLIKLPEIKQQQAGRVYLIEIRRNLFIIEVHYHVFIITANGIAKNSIEQCFVILMKPQVYLITRRKAADDTVIQCTLKGEYSSSSSRIFFWRFTT